MSQQLTIEFDHRPSFGKEDFIVAKCNVEAVSMIDNWFNWPSFALCLYGPEGSGKTHLANVFASHVSLAANHPYKIPFIKAKDIDMSMPHKLFEQHYCLIVEDLEELTDFEAAFHLYNLYKNEGGNILFTSKVAPARLNIPLADLRSRLNTVPAIEIQEPDDELLSALIIKLFSDRQLSISLELMNFILSNMERSFSYAKRLVSEIDTVSLAKKRAISIPVVKEAMENLKTNYQGELF